MTVNVKTLLRLDSSRHFGTRYSSGLTVPGGLKSPLRNKLFTIILANSAHSATLLGKETGMQSLSTTSNMDRQLVRQKLVKKSQ